MEDCVDELVNTLSDYNKAEEAEESGTSKSTSGGGLMEKIISHLPVTIPGISDTFAAGESSNEDKDRDKPEAKKEEEPEGIISSQHVASPVDGGPDPEF